MLGICLVLQVFALVPLGIGIILRCICPCLRATSVVTASAASASNPAPSSSPIRSMLDLLSKVIIWILFLFLYTQRLYGGALT